MQTTECSHGFGMVLARTTVPFKPLGRISLVSDRHAQQDDDTGSYPTLNSRAREPGHQQVVENPIIDYIAIPLHQGVISQYIAQS